MNKAITIPDWLKPLVAVGGIFLALIGTQLGLGVLCRTSWAFSYTPERNGGLFLTFILALSAVGTGGALAWQTLASLQKRPSRSLPRPSTDQLIGMALLYVVSSLAVIGIFLEGASAARFISFLLLPVIFALPPLWTFAWLRGKEADRLTWRYGLIVFTGSGFLSLISLLFWQGFTYFVLQPLRPGLAELLLIDLNSSPAFEYQPGLIYFLIGAILLSELAKPLPALLLWPQLNRRESFLGGALAGAGFAPLVTTFYWVIAPEVWFTVFTLTLMGAAIQPLSSGLVTQGWYGLAEKERGWPRWLAYYGLAVAIQILWNLGILITVGFTGVSGGLTSLGIWLFLFTLGLLSFWGSYSIIHQPEGERIAITTETDRSLALWGAACFLAIVPVGLIVLLTLQ